MNFFRPNWICIVFLFVLVLTALFTIQTLNHHRNNSSIYKRQINGITECLNIYHETQGFYPKNLNVIVEDLARIPSPLRNNLYDPWGIQYQYRYFCENDTFFLWSIGYKNSIIQKRFYLVFHFIVSLCLTILIFALIFVRFCKNGCLAIKQSFPIFFVFLIGFYTRLGDNEIVPLGNSFFIIKYFLIAILFFTALSLFLLIKKRDLIYFATLIIIVYAFCSISIGWN